MEHVSGDLIWKFLNGDAMSDEQLDVVSLHVADCDLCAERLANMAELGEYMPELMQVETPGAGITDRIMFEVQQYEQEKAAAAMSDYRVETAGFAPDLAASVPENVVPLAPGKARSPRLELFTRVATAAVVTGFLVLGSTGQSYAQQVPVFGKTIAAVSNSGNWFTSGTAHVYSELHYLFSVASFDLSK